MLTVWTIDDWLALAARRPGDGPLPRRTLLVPGALAGGVMRRLTAVRQDLAAGTAIVSYQQLAERVLRSWGQPECIEDPGVRPARLRVLFHQDLPLRYFDPTLLRTRPGWHQAFAHTIADLESHALRPDDLEIGCPTSEATRVHDLCLIWRRLDEAAGTAVSAQRACSLAADLLRQRPDRCPIAAPVTALVTPDVSAAEAALLTSVPASVIARLAARPDRASHRHRLTALFGTPAAETDAPAAVPTTPANARELDVLQAHLFEPPDRLIDPARQRSAGIDGSVTLEEYAGLDEELAGAAEWVAQQVTAGVPVNEIAVLCPSIDPLAALLADRLADLRTADGPLPVTVDEGVPAVRRPAAARTLAVIRALAAGLPATAVAALLPVLRRTDRESPAPTPSESIAFAWSLGTVGGTAADRQGGLDWKPRVLRRVERLRQQLAGENDPAARARLERDCATATNVAPALAALADTLGSLIESRSIAGTWTALRAFLADWLVQPGQGIRIETLLDSLMAPLLSLTGAAGDEALQIVEEALLAVRLPVGDSHRPGVFVGTIARAAGRKFEAVRVVGLAETAFPSTPRPDPVLCDASWLTDDVRRRIATPAVRAVQQLHAFDIVVRHARRGVALSCARMDADRTQREPSAVLVESLAALGRPDVERAAGGGIARDAGRPLALPNVRALARLAFQPARESAEERRAEMPIATGSWLRLVSDGRCTLPWAGSDAVDTARIRDRQAMETPSADDGVLDVVVPDTSVPGLTLDWPASPSVLERFARCPHWMLFDRVLHFREPATPPYTREIGQPHYGALLHQVLRAFYAAHGEAFFADPRRADAAAWTEVLDCVASDQLDVFLDSYPLLGAAARDAQARRLVHDARAVLRDDAASPDRRFVAVERDFETAIDVDGGSLHLRGRIDRIDVHGGTTLVRDFKTGRVRRRIAGDDPDLLVDLQIGIYGLVAPAAVDMPDGQVGTEYVHVRGGHLDVRSYRDDFAPVLEPRVRAWLGAMRRLLSARLFPRTHNEDDCRYCSFKPVCGPAALNRARVVRAQAADRLAPFGVLKPIAGVAENHP